jgi:hypothetical protein
MVDERGKTEGLTTNGLGRKKKSWLPAFSAPFPDERACTRVTKRALAPLLSIILTFPFAILLLQYYDCRQRLIRSLTHRRNGKEKKRKEQLPVDPMPLAMELQSMGRALAWHVL